MSVLPDAAVGGVAPKVLLFLEPSTRIVTAQLEGRPMDKSYKDELQVKAGNLP
jgi:hypothetical protein